MQGSHGRLPCRSHRKQRRVIRSRLADFPNPALQTREGIFRGSLCFWIGSASGSSARIRSELPQQSSIAVRGFSSVIPNHSVSTHGMNWSQVRKQVRSLICDELQGRVDFHKTVYRKPGDSAFERAWITIDGVEVFEWSDADLPARCDEAASIARNSADEHAGCLGYSLYRYLENSIAASLQSGNPIIRAFAMIDRRTGKRTLARIHLAPEEHKLVRMFYDLRIRGETEGAEGMIPQRRGDAE